MGEPVIQCIFCGRGESDDHRLVSGYPGRYICEPCVRVCLELFEEEAPAHATSGSAS